MVDLVVRIVYIFPAGWVYLTCSMAGEEAYIPRVNHQSI